jgi:hypothetical protein
MRIHKLPAALRRLTLLAALTGATAFQLQSCNPEVRNALLTGVSTSLNTFITTLVTQFFVTLATVQLPTTQNST